MFDNFFEILIRQFRQSRTFRLMFIVYIIGLTVLVIFTFLLYSKRTSSLHSLFIEENFFLYFVVGSVGALLLFLVFELLVGTTKSINENTKYASYDFKAYSNKIENLIERLESSVSKIRKGEKIDITLDDKKQEDLFSSIREGLDERILGKIAATYTETFRKEFDIAESASRIRRISTGLLERLRTELVSQTRRAIFNLFLGAILGGLGLFFLYQFAFFSITDKSEVHNVIYSTMRLSFVFLMELLAYFFLKLYRNGLEEVKYFQNEITNIEAKILAIEIAMDQKNNTILDHALRKLSDTERNFVIRKNQKTIQNDEIKNKKEDKLEKMSALMKQVLDLVKIQKGQT